MISFIRGTLFDVTENSLLIDCNDIGYEVFIPGTVNKILPGIGEELFLYTYMHVREDAVVLYGFASKDDLSVFKLLITVNGIGPKAAIGILSALTADDLRFAVLAEDSKTIERAPGVGKKTAGKMILELKDKFSLQDAFEKKLEQTESRVLPGAGQSVMKDEAVQALVALGYSATDAMKAVGKVAITEDMTAEDILKQSLKKIV